jgi:hypothetical protein
MLAVAFHGSPLAAPTDAPYTPVVPAPIDV